MSKVWVDILVIECKAFIFFHLHNFTSSGTLAWNCLQYQLLWGDQQFKYWANSSLFGDMTQSNTFKVISSVMSKYLFCCLLLYFMRFPLLLLSGCFHLKANNNKSLKYSSTLLSIQSYLVIWVVLIHCFFSQIFQYFYKLFK